MSRVTMSSSHDPVSSSHDPISSSHDLVSSSHDPVYFFLLFSPTVDLEAGSAWRTRAVPPCWRIIALCDSRKQFWRAAAMNSWRYAFTAYQLPYPYHILCISDTVPSIHKDTWYVSYIRKFRISSKLLCINHPIIPQEKMDLLSPFLPERGNYFQRKEAGEKKTQPSASRHAEMRYGEVAFINLISLIPASAP